MTEIRYSSLKVSRWKHEGGRLQKIRLRMTLLYPGYLIWVGSFFWALTRVLVRKIGWRRLNLRFVYFDFENACERIDIVSLFIQNFSYIALLDFGSIVQKKKRGGTGIGYIIASEMYRL